jgi:phage-related baseplate assembly protein
MIDLSQMPAPEAIETVEFAAIYKALKSSFLTDWAEAVASDPTLPTMDTLLDSSPISMVLRVAAWREVQLRARFNDGIKQMLIAYATGSNLIHLGAYLNVEKLDGETDERYRKRIQLRPEALSLAGPAGAYVYHALTAVPALIDATAIRSADGEVTVTLLASADAPQPTVAQIAVVRAALEETAVAPLTDTLIVQGPDVTDVDIDVVLTLYPGPDGAIVRTAVIKALSELKTTNAILNQDLTLSAIYGRAHQTGVQSVRIASPLADTAVSQAGFVRIASINVTIAAGRDT